MNPLNEFINQLPDYLGIFLLMLSTFLIGYYAAWSIQRSKYSKIVKKIKRQANLNKLNNSGKGEQGQSVEHFLLRQFQ